jgi:hypothetical protein
MKKEGIQAAGEAFSLKKENIQHFKTQNFLIFFYFIVEKIFFPGSDPAA